MSRPGVTKDIQTDELKPKLGAKRLHLSGEQLDEVFTLLADGKRGQSAGLISTSLQVNDFMAEWAVRHIEGKLKIEQNFRNQALEEYQACKQEDPQSYRCFLSRVFGIQGHAANGLVAKLRP